MRTPVVLQFVGRFLQIFAVMLALPLLVAIYYSESLLVSSGFMVASISAMLLGYAVKMAGNSSDPTTEEAMFATVLGWTLAVGFGAIPLMVHMNIFDAFFEASAGLTTTGISMFLEPGKLPKSILFWRSFMQWVGGLGILTFFIAVIRESGGVSRRLFSAEAHKTDSGSIRPSLLKSIVSLWKVYGFLTTVIVVVYIVLGMPPFDALLHAFSGISTGGFSTTSASIAGFSSVPIEIATTVFMFIGGVNFVLLYQVLRADASSILENSEFKLYAKLFLLVGAFTSLELFLSGNTAFNAVLDGMFQSAAVISSTGYSTMSLTALSMTLQAVFIAVMFFGGSLGSTAGGLKIFRLKTMAQLLRTRIQAYSLPDTAINEVKLDGHILESDTVRTISVLFFTWMAAVFLLTVFTLALEDVSLMAALSGTVSAVGNMGPVYMSGEKMVALSPLVKVAWIIGMLAGRLEMLPLLAIFNSDLFKDTS
ncbi:MAG: TrkH family potassium uptake protein [Candidatus Nanohaloarchaea archaeon]